MSNWPAAARRKKLFSTDWQMSIDSRTARKCGDRRRIRLQPDDRRVPFDELLQAQLRPAQTGHVADERIVGDALLHGHDVAPRDGMAAKYRRAGTVAGRVRVPLPNMGEKGAPDRTSLPALNTRAFSVRSDPAMQLSG